MSTKISGSKYAAMYGPTTGDKVRLADTSLVIEVEKDYTTYGDEVKFGGGKTIRDGMGQSARQTINFPARPSIYTIFGIRMTGGRLRRRGSVLFLGSEGGRSL